MKKKMKLKDASKKDVEKMADGDPKDALGDLLGATGSKPCPKTPSNPNPLRRYERRVRNSLAQWLSRLFCKKRA